MRNVYVHISFALTIVTKYIKQKLLDQPHMVFIVPAMCLSKQHLCYCTNAEKLANTRCTHLRTRVTLCSDVVRLWPRVLPIATVLEKQTFYVQEYVVKRDSDVVITDKNKHRYN